MFQFFMSKAIIFKRPIRGVAMGALIAAALAPTFGRAADPTQVFLISELDETPGAFTRLFGSEGTGRFGVPVTGGYDCDGDGHLDFGMASIVGDAPGRSRAGVSYLTFGDGTIGARIDTAAPVGDTRILRILGSAAHEIAGAEIWMGDVDGDGIGDFLIGRQNYSPDDSRLGAGALTVIFGSATLRDLANSGTAIDLANPPAEVEMVTLVGAAAYNRMGIWMRAGDITGDGIEDLIVGADEADGPDANNRGTLWVIRGGSHLRTVDTIDLAEFGSTPLAGHIARVLPPEGSADYHFASTCHIADIDQNGRGEIFASAALKRSGATLRIPGAPLNTGISSGGTGRGKAFIVWDTVFPESDWPAGFEFRIGAENSAEWSSIEGPLGSKRFGEELLGGFDCSGDGRTDLFIGDLCGDAGGGQESGLGIVFYDARILRGRAIDMSAPPADLQWTLIVGPRVGAIGSDTAAWGDFDGDGIDDLAIGNPHDHASGRLSAGTADVFYGRPGGWPDEMRVIEGEFPDPSTVRIARIEGALGVNGSNLGDTIFYSAVAADFNDDGLTDLVFNEMLGDGVLPEARDTGNLLMISGAALLSAPEYELRLEARISGAGLEIRYTRPVWDPVDWHVEVTSQFDAWFPAENFEESVSPTSNEAREEVTLTFPLESIESPTFFRVRWESLR